MHPAIIFIDIAPTFYSALLFLGMARSGFSLLSLSCLSCLTGAGMGMGIGAGATVGGAATGAGRGMASLRSSTCSWRSARLCGCGTACGTTSGGCGVARFAGMGMVCTCSGRACAGVCG